MAAMEIGMSKGLLPDEPVAGNAYEAEEHLAATFISLPIWAQRQSICSIQRR